MKAAADYQCFTGDPARIRRREEGNGRCDILGLTDAPQGRNGFDFLPEGIFEKAAGMHALGDDQPRVDRVNSDISRP